MAFLGPLEPRKNVPNLIRGFVRAVGDIPDPPALVLAGGIRDVEVDAAVEEVPSTVRVLRPGFLSFADLCGFLGGAVVAAFPSRGEGFGLPVLEAMGLRRAGAHHPPHLAARGGRRRGRLHRAGRREHRRGAAHAALVARAEGGAVRGRDRPRQGVHLGRLGRGAPALLPACGAE
ncbi:hypothetical protein GCM10018952_06330 [Streptosporangium vulgare]